MLTKMAECTKKQSTLGLVGNVFNTIVYLEPNTRSVIFQGLIIRERDFMALFVTLLSMEYSGNAESNV